MTEILLAKLMPPRVGKGIIDRPRLIKLLKRFDERKLTLLIAPAGYGKTVLMLQLAKQAKRTVVWYQLDVIDNDPAVFLQYLTMGLQRHFPALETKFSQLIKQENFESGLKLWVTVIVNSLQKVDEPLLLSFDDYHVITEPVLHKFIQQLLDYLPAHIHIMISSRTTPPLNLSRFKISDEILVLKTEELCFTKEELQDFLTERSLQLPSETLEYLNQEMNGWPAAIKLATDSLSGNTFSLKTKNNLSEIYEYLAAEIIDQQPQDIQEFLIKTSVLEEMTAESCDMLLKRNDSRQILTLLEHRNLFLIPLAGIEKTYRYHQLFREFLLDRLGAFRAELQREAGLLLLTQSKVTTAMELFISAGAKDEIKQVLYKAGLQVFRQGRWQTVARWLESFRELELMDDPWLSFYRAWIEVYQDRLEQAEIHIKNALTCFTGKKDIAGLVECQLLKARILRCLGRCQESLELLEQVEQEIDPKELQLRFDLPLEKTLLFIIIGRFNEAEALLSSALVIARRGNDGYLMAHLLEGLGNLYYFQGKFSKSLQFYKQGAEASPEQILPSYYMQDSIATIYQDWGELDKAFEYAERSVILKEKYGLNGSLPSAYIQLASIYVDKNDLKRAEELYKKAIQLIRDNNGERFYLKLNLIFLARCLGLQGRWLEAREKVIEALEEKLQSELVNAVCQVMGALVFIRTGSTTEGSCMLNAAVITLEKISFKKALYIGYAEQAWYYLRTGEVALSLEAARKSLGLATRLNSIQYFITYFEMLYPVLKLTLENGIEPSFVQRIMIRLGKRSLNILLEMAKHPDQEVRCRIITPLVEIGGEQAESILRSLAKDPDAEVRLALNETLQRYQSHPLMKPETKIVNDIIMIRTLGKFQVTLESEKISTTNWRTTKTRDLLAFLVHQRNPVSKEVILEELWPDNDFDKSQGLFHTSLYYLRQILEKIGYPDLIIYHNKHYELTTKLFTTDRIQFQELITAGFSNETPPEKTTDFLERAITIYTGDYLQELDYVWLLPDREYLKNIHFEARLRLARYYLERKDYNRAISHLQLLVGLDSLSEEIHRLLMTAYSGLGNRSAVREQYHSLTLILKNELGVNPCQETQTIYNNLYQTKN